MKISDPDPTYQLILDPDPDPGRKKVSDPYGSGSATLVYTSHIFSQVTISGPQSTGTGLPLPSESAACYILREYNFLR